MYLQTSFPERFNVIDSKSKEIGVIGELHDYIRCYHNNIINQSRLGEAK